ncbi:outer membrane beta-barrel protein [Pontibacter harenae]|uniref:outer membrane beta-barrel protein n=1 Tax=Pontibacter harenae TaxID=2894083 RepID=UPI001E371665|nr:outer membrane beta-barrel protein [Pontibacter harenae]MCC9166230.1 outer membrane beta-barrel protein [Pontibacter harenae]
MKRYIAVLVLALIVASVHGAFAQLSAGSTYTGLHAGGSIQRPDANTKVASINVSPTVGYFVSSRWMVGLQGWYNTSRTKAESISQIPIPSSSGYTTYISQSNYELKENAFGFGPVARYFMPLSNRFTLFAEGNAGFSSEKTKVELKQSSGHYQPVSPGQPAGNIVQNSQFNTL